MRVLYVGQYSEGTTSRMRALQINEVLKPTKFDVIDINIPFFKTNKIFRSIGFRFKKGPLIFKINNYIKEQFLGVHYDLIWIDKGVYIKSRILKELKDKAGKMVHFTPDMAFYENRSSYFEKTLNDYDYCITTKSAETKEYLKRIPKSKLLITTQGFSKIIHKSYYQFHEKTDSVVFIGLAEPYRFIIAEKLLKAGINLKLVGKNWNSFIKKNKHFDNLEVLGDGIYDEEYSKLISSSKFALGLLSKRFPELHTTRTFEIPACGTALLTEANAETSKFYSNDEVIFYKDEDELVEKIKYYMEHTEELKILTKNGYHKVIEEGFDYYSILDRLLKTILN